MSKKKKYKIGFSCALSGVEQKHGEAQVDAVKIAFEEASQENLGFDLELAIEDDGAETNKAVKAAKTFSEDPLLMGVIGPNGSDATKAAAPIYHKFNLPAITFSGSVTDASQQGYSTFFRVIPNDDTQAQIFIEFLKKYLNLKKLLLVNDDTKFAIGLNEYIKKYAEINSIEIFDTIEIKEGKDFSELVKKSTHLNPEYIFFAGMEPVCNAAALKLREEGIKSIYLGTDAIKPSKFLTTPGYDIAGPYQSNVCADLYRDNQTCGFTEKFKARYGDIYTVYTAEAYVTTRLLINAMKECGPDITRKKMVKTLASIKMASIIGPISFQDNGELEVSKIGFYKFTNQKDLEFIGFSTDIL